MRNNKHWLTKSWAYLKANGLVKATLSSPEKLAELISRASSLSSKNIGPLNELGDSLKSALRLVRRYAKGDYRDVSGQSIGLIVASIIYLVMPLDVLPDYILGLGFTDDAALLAWTLRSVRDDLIRFNEWESANDPHSTNF